ncbi:MAG: hypothetical protein ACREJB_12820 [Planctomycetaceae bacterium]
MPSDDCIELIWQIVNDLEHSGEDLRAVTLDRMKTLLTEELRARLAFRGANDSPTLPAGAE